MLTRVLKSFDTFIIIATTSISITLSLTRFVLIAIQTSAVKACGLSISKKVIFAIVLQEYNMQKKQYENDQQTSESLISYIENVYTIISLIKMKVSLYIIFRLNTLKEQKTSIFLC